MGLLWLRDDRPLPGTVPPSKYEVPPWTSGAGLHTALGLLLASAPKQGGRFNLSVREMSCAHRQRTGQASAVTMWTWLWLDLTRPLTGQGRLNFPHLSGNTSSSATTYEKVRTQGVHGEGLGHSPPGLVGKGMAHSLPRNRVPRQALLFAQPTQPRGWGEGQFCGYVPFHAHGTEG